jgi:hypothetical protein
VRWNYAKSQRNVRRNCQLSLSIQKSSVPYLKEFRRNTPKGSDNEEESTNFIPVLVNKKLLLKVVTKWF